MPTQSISSLPSINPFITSSEIADQSSVTVGTFLSPTLLVPICVCLAFVGSLLIGIFILRIHKDGH